MRHVRRISVSVLVFLMLVGLATSFALAAPPAQDPDNGMVLWEQNLCKNCHGAAGEGMWGGPLAGNDKTPEEWIAQVRSPRNRMPTFSPEKVTDEMIVDMHAYLTSLSKPDGFTPADAGLPSDAPAGQQLLVEKRCVACHSTTLRTPRRNMPMFAVEQVSDEEAGLIAEFLASQLSPASLPATGGAGSSILLVTLVLLGSGLVLTGIVLRGRRARL
jgi:mono/diheme cytochrome c family protein